MAVASTLFPVLAARVRNGGAHDGALGSTRRRYGGGCVSARTLSTILSEPHAGGVALDFASFTLAA
jgi:hypothetical protein